MSPAASTVSAMHHPWRELRALPHIDLRWHVGAPAGETQWWSDGSVVISLSKDLKQTERRSTLTHEIRHVLRGRPPIGEAARRKEEREIDLEAARLLIPLDALIDALRWTGNHHELAETLWVDFGTFVNRIKGLTEGEWRTIREALNEIERSA